MVKTGFEATCCKTLINLESSHGPHKYCIASHIQPAGFLFDMLFCSCRYPFNVYSLGALLKSLHWFTKYFAKETPANMSISVIICPSFLRQQAIITFSAENTKQ